MNHCQEHLEGFQFIFPDDEINLQSINLEDECADKNLERGQFIFPDDVIYSQSVDDEKTNCDHIEKEIPNHGELEIHYRHQPEENG